ncbi:hypothetical protein J2772_000702 [Chryseobacterium jejuense]|nr:hypothetical protein [Chryseobacterium jejuense]
MQTHNIHVVTFRMTARNNFNVKLYTVAKIIYIRQ